MVPEKHLTGPLIPHTNYELSSLSSLSEKRTLSRIRNSPSRGIHEMVERSLLGQEGLWV